MHAFINKMVNCCVFRGDISNDTEVLFYLFMLFIVVYGYCLSLSHGT